MRILFLPNWDVHALEKDNELIQSPDKQVIGEPYWFFRYFPENTEVDIIDRQKRSLFYTVESRYLKFYIYQSLKAFFCKKKYDVVISHGAQSGLIYSLLNRFRAKKRRPLHVIIDVGAMNGGRINQLETAFIRLALKSHPAIIYHSSVQKELYETLYKKEIKHARFIRFGVNTDEFHPIPSETKNYILAFGYAKRDYETLLKAWRLIDTDISLYIIGDPTILSDKNIHSLPKVNVFQLKEYIAQSLFVVVPLPVFNYSYGQMSFLQSLAMAKPVIVTQTPSSIDYIHENSGLFPVNPYDVDDMKQKLTYLLDNKSNLVEWGRDGRHYVENSLNEKIMGTEIYRFILACST